MPKYKAFVTLILYGEAESRSEFMVHVWDEIAAHQDDPATGFFNLDSIKVLPDE